MEGIKHLIECNCILPQMRGVTPPLFHSFIAFSVVSDDGSVLEKFSQCNNCGIIHRIYDICKSELLKKESHVLIQTFSDISLSIPSEVSSILTTYKCDIATWEHVQFIFQNELWGLNSVVSKEYENGTTQGKRLIIEGPSKFRIEPFSYTEVV
jgi:hypothetical protein